MFENEEWKKQEIKESNERRKLDRLKAKVELVKEDTPENKADKTIEKVRGFRLREVKEFLKKQPNKKKIPSDCYYDEKSKSWKFKSKGSSK